MLHATTSAGLPTIGPGALQFGNVATGCPNAWFSILSPGYYIPVHRGPTNGIIRVHLGLLVPRHRRNCRVRVDKQLLHWKEGKCIVFDDYYEHEVWNETDEHRVVQFFDVDRPMRPLGRFVN